MAKRVTIIGAGLAGSEAALQLASRDIQVTLVEMRPVVPTPVHHTASLAELVCSNSLKSTKPDSAAGMLKEELAQLGSFLLAASYRHKVEAGGALAVDRTAFADDVTRLVMEQPNINLERREAVSIEREAAECDALILATGPLTSDDLSGSLANLIGADYLAFFDAAAPIVIADSLDFEKLFRQSRYETGPGDYWNAPFDKEEYDRFIDALISADRVMKRDFETKDLFQACQPIEELARSGRDAPRFGPLKPVGLIDPRTQRRPWAALQLRAEDAHGQSYNLVGFQTNLTFSEQQRVFSLIPGLEHAEFSRYGVMHRNTFINAPQLLDASGQLQCPGAQRFDIPIFVAGQLAGTEGYCEAIRSGLHSALSVAAVLRGIPVPLLPKETVFGALMAYATNPHTAHYQPMHVNFGILEPLSQPVRNKRERYRAYERRGNTALAEYRERLIQKGLVDPAVCPEASELVKGEEPKEQSGEAVDGCS